MRPARTFLDLDHSSCNRGDGDRCSHRSDSVGAVTCGGAVGPWRCSGDYRTGRIRPHAAAQWGRSGLPHPSAPAGVVSKPASGCCRATGRAKMHGSANLRSARARERVSRGPRAEGKRRLGGALLSQRNTTLYVFFQSQFDGSHCTASPARHGMAWLGSTGCLRLGMGNLIASPFAVAHFRGAAPSPIAAASITMESKMRLSRSRRLRITSRMGHGLRSKVRTSRLAHPRALEYHRTTGISS